MNVKLRMVVALLLGWGMFAYAEPPSKTSIVESMMDVTWPLISEEDVGAQEAFLLGWAEVMDEVGDAEKRDALQYAAISLQTETCVLSEATYRNYYERFPNHPLVLNNLAYLLVTERNCSQEAWSLILKIPVAQRDATVLDTMAWVQFRLGHTADALQTILSALELARQQKEHHPLLFSHAGDIFYANGFYREADHFWLNALRILRALKKAGATEWFFMQLEVDPTLLTKKRLSVRRLHASAFEQNKK